MADIGRLDSSAAPRNNEKTLVDRLMEKIIPNGDPEPIVGIRCLQAIDWYYTKLVNFRLPIDQKLNIMADYMAWKFGYDVKYQH